MTEIFAYAIGIMYTPGPVNLLGLHSGLNKGTRSHLGFFIGVGSAMFILFVLLGYLGFQLIDPQILPYISLAGCVYILYVAWKVANASVDLAVSDRGTKSLGFRDGLFIQLLNPKALLATLPISTMQFPSVGITGSSILVWSGLLGILAFGAPTSYSLVGSILGKGISNPRFFRVFNLTMAALLIYVSLSIGYEHVFSSLVSAE
jgi:threonine/homoserine/homoserine lactone efflux protein